MLEGIFIHNVTLATMTEKNTVATKLRELLNHSYCPYSKFKVACIVIDNEGNNFAGVNVENGSFGLTVCAERVAIANMISQGKTKISEIYLAW